MIEVSHMVFFSAIDFIWSFISTINLFEVFEMFSLIFVEVMTCYSEEENENFWMLLTF